MKIDQGFPFVAINSVAKAVLSGSSATKMRANVETKRIQSIGCHHTKNWRRLQDSNLRDPFGVNSLSKRADSTTLPRLRTSKTSAFQTCAYNAATRRNFLKPWNLKKILPRDRNIKRTSGAKTKSQNPPPLRWLIVSFRPGHHSVSAPSPLLAAIPFFAC